MKIGNKILLAAMGAVALSTIVGMLLQRTVIRQQCIELTRNTMRGALVEAENVRASISKLGDGAFDMEKLCSRNTTRAKHRCKRASFTTRSPLRPRRTRSTSWPRRKITSSACPSTTPATRRTAPPQQSAQNVSSQAVVVQRADQTIAEMRETARRNADDAKRMSPRSCNRSAARVCGNREGVTQLHEAIQRIDSSTQSSAGVAEETAAAADELTAMSISHKDQLLDDLVAVIKGDNRQRHQPVLVSPAKTQGSATSSAAQQALHRKKDAGSKAATRIDER